MSTQKLRQITTCYPHVSKVPLKVSCNNLTKAKITLLVFCFITQLIVNIILTKLFKILFLKRPTLKNQIILKPTFPSFRTTIVPTPYRKVLLITYLRFKFYIFTCHEFLIAF
jgi:hypothetical protein